MARVGLLSCSDGRDFVSRDLRSLIASVEDQITNRLQAQGYDVLRASGPIESNALAVTEARAINSRRPDVAIINIPVWAFPHFTLLAASELSCPLILFSNLSPQYPGMVGMLAAAGALDQIGRQCGRAWGDIDQDQVYNRLSTWIRAGVALHRLRGTTFGRIGGRPMGMYTAVANADQWMAQFGVDVEEIDQWELVRRSDDVDPNRVRAGRAWLENHCAGVHYDGKQLTPELLERQVRTYHAMRDVIDEWHLDFSGIKGQPELTTHFVTMDVTEAFLNDPYDWEGPKDPHICATEADMDGALTMQILKWLSSTPVLFADLRYFDTNEGVWDLCNSGQHATWFAARSGDPAENLRHVHLYPEGFYFPAGGASIHHLAAPGEFTFARLTRLHGAYRMHVMLGDVVQFERDVNERLMRQSTYEWPHAFTRFKAESDEILSRYGSNHIHGVPGDHVDALKAFCRLAGITYDGFGSSS